MPLFDCPPYSTESLFLAITAVPVESIKFHPSFPVKYALHFVYANAILNSSHPLCSSLSSTTGNTEKADQPLPDLQRHKSRRGGQSFFQQCTRYDIQYRLGTNAGRKWLHIENHHPKKAVTATDSFLKGNSFKPSSQPAEETHEPENPSPPLSDAFPVPA